MVDMGIQLVGWAFAAALKTEKFYDLCGSLAFASTAALTFASSGGLARQVLATSMVWFCFFLSPWILWVPFLQLSDYTVLRRNTSRCA